jgi:hypothetical protein
MKLKDWEIYNRASKTSAHPQRTDRILAPMDPIPESLPNYLEEWHRTVEQVERLPEEYVELATRILKQFLR